ncbi:hypothetical protein ACOMHN_043145 [Nucella lapillus]
MTKITTTIIISRSIIVTTTTTTTTIIIITSTTTTRIVITITTTTTTTSNNNTILVTIIIIIIISIIIITDHPCFSRSDLRRTRLQWSKTYTTPGEKSLLRAWERNGPTPGVFPPAPFLTLRAPNHTAPGPLSHTPSMAAGGGGGAHTTKTGSSASGTRISSLPRRHHQSEPFDRSRGYPSDEGEDDIEEEDDEEEEDEAQVGSSTVSADVSCSSPRSSGRLQSPCQRSPTSSEYRRRRNNRQQPAVEIEQFCGGLHPVMLNGGNAYPTEPAAYDLSDHFQVSLPIVTEGRRGRWDRKGTPNTPTTTTTTTTRPPFSLHPTDRRPRPVGDVPSAADCLTSQEASGEEPSPRESTVSRGVVSTPASTLPSDTPRSDTLYTSLPAIAHA